MFNNFMSFLSIVIIGAATLWVLSFILPSENKDNLEKTKQDIKDEVKQEIKTEQRIQQPSEYPDYDLLNLFNPIIIASNAPSHAVDNKNITGRVKKTLYSRGKFSRMYVFFEASVDNGRPLSIYDDIYLTFNYQGGHLLPTDSLPTPPGDISRLLFSAKTLPARNLEDKSQVKDVDVLKIFNNNSQTGVDVFLSTARKGGLINNFIIFYECEENSECAINDKQL